MSDELKENTGCLKPILGYLFIISMLGGGLYIFNNGHEARQEAKDKINSKMDGYIQSSIDTVSGWFSSDDKDGEKAQTLSTEELGLSPQSDVVDHNGLFPDDGLVPMSEFSGASGTEVAIPVHEFSGVDSLSGNDNGTCGLGNTLISDNVSSYPSGVNNSRSGSRKVNSQQRRGPFKPFTERFRAFY